MNTLISILLAVLNDPTTDNTSREIARQILLNHHALENLKVSQLAEKSFCNASTVTRFCKHLGFSSFSDMKSFMITSHEIRQQQIRHHMELTDENELLEHIAGMCSRQFDKENFIKECELFNQAIHEAPRAVIIGAVFPVSMTFHYMEDMNEMNKCIYNAPIHRNLQAPANETDAVLIVISFTGRIVSYCAKEYDEILEQFPRTILMTGFNHTSANSREMVFHLPFEKDDEINNAAFIEIMRYLKYDYYRTYFQKEQ